MGVAGRAASSEQSLWPGSEAQETSKLSAQYVSPLGSKTPQSSFPFVGIFPLSECRSSSALVTQGSLTHASAISFFFFYQIKIGERYYMNSLG